MAPENLGSAQESDDAPYLEWNRRVALFWLARPFESSEVYLTVTPRGLAAALWECDGLELDAEAAEEEFVKAVRTFYQRRILAAEGDVARLARLSPGENLPLCAAFLGFLVLAAFRMHADDDNRSTAYWARLSRLLECELVRGTPQGVSKEGFERLWRFVSEWMMASKLKPIFLPTEDVLRRYVAYPLAHVPLRQVDLEKLPDFFQWANYAPGSAIALDRLREDWEAWLSARPHLTRAGRAACEDRRRDALLYEVAQELKAWDGVVVGMGGRRVAPVELTIDIVLRRPQLSYLARRPSSFPDVFDDGLRRFESLQEGWYDPIPVAPEDGALLLEGFEWAAASSSGTVALTRGGSKAIAFARSEDYSELTSRRRLLQGVPCAMLVHKSAVEVAQRRLQELTGTRCDRIDGAPTLPADWSLYPKVLVKTAPADSMPGLEALEVDSAAELMTTGGLRIGRRAAWLLGAPPRVLLSGARTVEVLVDRKPTRVSEDGVVQWSPRQAGAHTVEAARAHRRINLVHPDLAKNLPVLASAPVAEEYVVAVPKGKATLLGATPGQLAVRDERTPFGVARMEFDPVWLLRQSPKGLVLYLPLDPRPPGRAAQAGAAQWATAILRTARSEPRLARHAGITCATVEKLWRRYVHTAEEIEQRQRGSP